MSVFGRSSNYTPADFAPTLTVRVLRWATVTCARPGAGQPPRRKHGPRSTAKDLPRTRSVLT